MALAARDKKPVLTLVEQAQLVYLLSRYPKKQVLDDATDVARLEARLEGMRAAARALSASLREEHAAIPWDELAKKPDTPDLAWRKAKRIAPTVLRELMPALEGEPEAAFFLRPASAPKARPAKAPARDARRRSTAARAR